MVDYVISKIESDGAVPIALIKGTLTQRSMGSKLELAIKNPARGFSGKYGVDYSTVFPGNSNSRDLAFFPDGALRIPQGYTVCEARASVISEVLAHQQGSAYGQSNGAAYAHK